ncbi:hypothetical protein [Enterobacteria phage UAB_Phi20]|nr:hypothetical protein [Enterobacteria phage UAB_Phi20]ADM32328.1 hypothetical protein [Enterobacteria phage UAB_Phi20]
MGNQNHGNDCQRAGKTKGYIVCLLLAASHRGEYERHTALGC